MFTNFKFIFQFRIQTNRYDTDISEDMRISELNKEDMNYTIS